MEKLNLRTLCYILVRCRVQETTRIREPRGPRAVASERSEDATKGPQGSLIRVVSMDDASNLLRAIATRSFKSNTEEMASGFDIFGDAVRKWLQEPETRNPSLSSL